MSKKRKTRAQKARTIQRRQQFIQEIAPPSQTLDMPEPIKPAEEAAIAVVKPEEPLPPPSAKIQHKDLRASLVIVGSLITAQIVIWLVFHFTTIDNRLYNLIKI
jgi:hypothetical protein